jgi:hypothetical protein
MTMDAAAARKVTIALSAVHEDLQNPATKQEMHELKFFRQPLRAIGGHHRLCGGVHQRIMIVFHSSKKPGFSEKTRFRA